MKNALAPLALALISLAACGSDPSDPNTNGMDDCSKVASLTYANYGQKFITNYCARCHGADVKGDDRCAGPAEDPCSARAPEAYSFSSLDEIKTEADTISGVVGNKAMPYNAPGSISDEDRAQFVLWLECGPK